MNNSTEDINEQKHRFERAYRSEKPRLLGRLRAAGKTVEEAEDLVHEVYAETLSRLPVLSAVRNLPAWINSLFRRRLIDAWRHDRVRSARGETDVKEEILREIISETGLDPLDGFVRENLVDALNDAIRCLPVSQRKVLKAQVYEGMTFRQIAEETGESIDTLMARKRYALENLCRALKHWIED